MWHEQEAFNLAEYNAYLDEYMRRTRLRIVQHSNTDEIPDPHTSDMYPTYDTFGSRQYAGELAYGLHTDVMNFDRQLSIGPLLVHRSQIQPWVKRLEQRIKDIYRAITCTRTSDVVQHQPQSTQLPRHSMHRHQPRHSMHRHQPHPRLQGVEPMPHPPPPDQPGSSAWHQPQHHAPSSSFMFQPTPQHHNPTPGFMFHPHPTGMVPPAGSYAYHDASASGSGLGSEPEEPPSQQNMWSNMFSTPPPWPTQDTQYDQGGSEIPPRNIRPPTGGDGVRLPHPRAPTETSSVKLTLPFYVSLHTYVYFMYETYVYFMYETYVYSKRHIHIYFYAQLVHRG
ncbi:uncharacterized protein LOC123396564 [Hordeum vulgare subsp. vulgare]|uniref:uncharacterized protein LOC123396564 n=1 Tax=Hordeum vulgare subsp. vulgare TaxID=112509 RepID=UPI001D1A51E5|nr:uncharacterized protein LOC123396564 [Hordeum vulgare subsp. vulgare]